jgi:hypothetical protein
VVKFWCCSAGKSALQVSKKFNIPSRTLYDKVKKMGITTGRQQQRKSLAGSFNGKPIILLFAPLFAKLFNLYSLLYLKGKFFVPKCPFIFIAFQLTFS